MPDMVGGTVSIGAADAHAAIGEKTSGVKNAAENIAIHALLKSIEILILLAQAASAPHVIRHAMARCRCLQGVDKPHNPPIRTLSIGEVYGVKHCPSTGLR